MCYLELDYRGCQIAVEAGQVQKAQNQPISRERIQTQMRKSGDAPYVLEPLEIAMGDGIFLPIQTLNQLRRLGFEALAGKLADQHRRPLRVDAPLSGRRVVRPRAQESSHASCETAEQFRI
ncbi:MAG: DUF3656 domain-containing protein [Blautia sp.]